MYCTTHICDICRSYYFIGFFFLILGVAGFTALGLGEIRVLFLILLFKIYLNFFPIKWVRMNEIVWHNKVLMSQLSIKYNNFKNVTL